MNMLANFNSMLFPDGCLTFFIVFFQTHLTFGKEFTEAVEMKQVAQQEAERARFVVEKVFIFKACTWRKYLWSFHERKVQDYDFSFSHFRQSNRNKRPSSQQRETPKLPCSSPTP